MEDVHTPEARAHDAHGPPSMTNTPTFSEHFAGRSYDDHIDRAQALEGATPAVFSAPSQSVGRTASAERQDAMDDVNIHTGSSEFHGSRSVLPLLSNLRLNVWQTRIRYHEYRSQQMLPLSPDELYPRP